MANKQKILIVDDDNNIAELISLYLTKECFETMIVNDGESALPAVESFQPNLILLDIMLPGIDGVELLRRMRADPALSAVPVVMATAKGAEHDKVQSLDLGADYYLTKPFGVMEFLACVRSVLRRCGGAEPGKILGLEGIRMDLSGRTVTVDGERAALTYKEFELLRLFLSHPGVAFTREQLMSDIWGTDYCGESRTVDMHIRTLRGKLGPYGDRIETVRGVGYRLEGKL